MLRHYNGGARVCRSAIDEAVEHIAFEETHAIGDGMAFGVAARDGDATGAGADVGDLQAFAGESLFAASAEFADGEAIEGDFDDVLGFGAGNQDVGCYFELEAPEFLFAGEMLRRFAIRAAF